MTKKQVKKPVRLEFKPPSTASEDKSPFVPLRPALTRAANAAKITMPKLKCLEKKEDKS